MPLKEILVIALIIGVLGAAANSDKNQSTCGNVLTRIPNSVKARIEQLFGTKDINILKVSVSSDPGMKRICCTVRLKDGLTCDGETYSDGESHSTKKSCSKYR